MRTFAEVIVCIGCTMTINQRFWGVTSTQEYLFRLWFVYKMVILRVSMDMIWFLKQPSLI